MEGSAMNNLKVTFTAHSPYKFTGSYFKRKPYEPLLEVIFTRYIPFPLKYPAKVTVVGDAYTTTSIRISNTQQNFIFSNPTWNSGWHSFDSIFAEEINPDRKSKKILHIYPMGIHFLGKVALNDAVYPTTHPFQNIVLVLHNEQRHLAKHYTNCTYLINEFCNLMKATSSFSFLDVVISVLATFKVHIPDIDILNVEGVIDFQFGKLISAQAYFEDALVEAHHYANGCTFICATKHSIIQKFPDGCIAIRSDLVDETEKNSELESALAKIEKMQKQTFLIPNG